MIQAGTITVTQPHLSGSPEEQLRGLQAQPELLYPLVSQRDPAEKRWREGEKALGMQ